MWVLFLTMVIFQKQEPTSFKDLVNEVFEDVTALPNEEAKYTMYLTFSHLPTKDKRELASLLNYHTNAMSRGRKLYPLRQVSDNVYALRWDVLRYPAKAVDDLKRGNHYFAIRTEIQTIIPATTKQVVKYAQNGQPYYATEEVSAQVVKTKEDHLPAYWLPSRQMLVITKLTGLNAPMMRADNFLFETGAVLDRKGHNYYDFLELKSRDDVIKLANVDFNKAILAAKERAAMVPTSGVGLNNRLILWYRSLNGSYWVTKDAKTSKDFFRDKDGKIRKQNVIRNFFEKFDHDAEEIVFTLLNGLPGYYICNQDGVQADSVPDFIAAHHISPNNRKILDVPDGCIRCHDKAGLIPFTDYGRKIYDQRTGIKLGTLGFDFEFSERVEVGYLGDIATPYAEDVKSYSKVILEISGFKPDELSAAWARQWARYIDDPVTIDRAAAECGVTEEYFRARLLLFANKKGKLFDPVLQGYLLVDPLPIRREYFEDMFPELMLIMMGGDP